MKKITSSLIIGFFAGIIDVTPMVIQKLNWYANSSAFIFWIVMGFIIAHISLPLKNWLKGLIIALISSTPIMIIVASNNFFSIFPILIMTTILGSLVGYCTGKHADQDQNQKINVT